MTPVSHKDKLNILAAMYDYNLPHRFDKDVYSLLFAHNPDVTDEKLPAPLPRLIPRGDLRPFSEVRPASHNKDAVWPFAASFYRDPFVTFVSRNHNVGNTKSKALKRQ